MIKFLAFADFHYKKMMYSTKIEFLERILLRAKAENVDFVIHAGDFCHDYKNSPELFETYLNNPYNLPVYGVIGNHDMEFENVYDFVTSRLTNSKVNFGEPLYNETSSGHWYTDVKNFRIIGIDSNYTYCPAEDIWEHNHALTPRKGNLYDRSLSPKQLLWLEETIRDAEEKNLKVIAVAHDSFTDLTFVKSPDAQKVQEIFAKFPKTVLLAINGHCHTDNFKILNDVAYLDLNTATLGAWDMKDTHHYSDEHTFTFTNYVDGKKVSTEEVPLTKLDLATNAWEFAEPISAVITITDDNKLIIKGESTQWEYGVAPALENIKDYNGVRPCITSRIVQL